MKAMTTTIEQLSRTTSPTVGGSDIVCMHAPDLVFDNMIDVLLLHRFNIYLSMIGCLMQFATRLKKLVYCT